MSGADRVRTRAGPVAARFSFRAFWCTRDGGNAGGAGGQLALLPERGVLATSLPTTPPQAAKQGGRGNQKALSDFPSELFWRACGPLGEERVSEDTSRSGKGLRPLHPHFGGDVRI